MRRIGAFLVVAAAVAVFGVLGFSSLDGGAAQAEVMIQPASWHPTVPAQSAEYVGAKDGCRRCHLREFRDWEDTAHATAMETLEAEGEAENADCVKCHTTGYGTETGFKSMEETPELANVQCEACHGPGSDYKDRDVMKDREASVAAGLVIPDEETCRSCHNEESPTFTDFDFETAVEEGVHEIER